MKKLESLIKKAKNLNIKGVIEGVHNLSTGEVDDIAIVRAAVCSGCPSNIIEPIEELAIEDSVIPEISKRCCKECGCALPYLTRQFKKTCSLKKWEI